MSFANFDLEAQRLKGSKATEGANKNNVASRGTLPPTDEGLLNSISSNLNRFIGASSKFDKLQQQLGTKRDTLSLRNDISNQVSNCNVLEIETNKLLNVLLLKNNENGKNVMNSKVSISEEKLRKECNQVFKNYHLILRMYNEKINSVVIDEVYRKNIRATTNEQTPLLSSEGMTNGDSNGNSNNYITQSQQQLLVQEQSLTAEELAYHDSVIQERDEAIENIHRGVQDINKIFKDLNEMVSEQGQQIDTIEDNLHLFANNNQLASNELVKADRYQRAKGKYTCILLVFLIVVMVIVLAVIS